MFLNSSFNPSRKRSFATLKEGNRPVSLEKREVQNRINPMIQKNLAILVRQDSSAGTELIIFPSDTPSKVSTV